MFLVSTEDVRSSEKFRVDLFKRGDEGLDAKREAIEDTGDD